MTTMIEAISADFLSVHTWAFWPLVLKLWSQSLLDEIVLKFSKNHVLTWSILSTLIDKIYFPDSESALCTLIEGQIVFSDERKLRVSVLLSVRFEPVSVTVAWLDACVVEVGGLFQCFLLLYSSHHGFSFFSEQINTQHLLECNSLPWRFRRSVA